VPRWIDLAVQFTLRMCLYCAVIKNNFQREVLMPKGEMLQVENAAVALRNQNGTFKVISPNGYIFQVICRRGRKIRIREIGEPEHSAFSELKGWQIEKIA